MLWHKASPTPDALPGGGHPRAAIHCRHCDSSKVKLTFRRRDTSPSGEPGLTLIYRCAGCDQFTTVCS
jgi:hypothetical protein